MFERIKILINQDLFNLIASFNLLIMVVSLICFNLHHVNTWLVITINSISTIILFIESRGKENE